MFSSEQEKRQNYPHTQKCKNKNIKNYVPVSLLPICANVFGRIVFNKMFGFFLDNKFIPPNQ